MLAQIIGGIVGTFATHLMFNRPIVVTPKGAKLCRPSETVLDILANSAIGRFVKEDGEVVETAPDSRSGG